NRSRLSVVARKIFMQTGPLNAESLIRHGILLFDARRNVVHFGLRLIETNAVFQTCDGSQAMISSGEHLGRQGEGYPKLGDLRKSETARHHADDGSRPTAYHDVPADDVWIGAEASLP